MNCLNKKKLKFPKPEMSLIVLIVVGHTCFGNRFDFTTVRTTIIDQFRRQEIDKIEMLHKNVLPLYRSRVLLRLKYYSKKAE